MSNYHTHFSCALNLGGADCVRTANQIFAEMEKEYLETFGDIGFQLSNQPGGVEIALIQDGVGGDPDHVIEFVRRCCKAISLCGLWGFQWAYTCDRHSLNAFGGGAHLINMATGETAGYVDTNEWLTLRATCPEATS